MMLLGMIYYVWKKNGKIVSLMILHLKKKIKGKIGKFSFDNKEDNSRLEHL